MARLSQEKVQTEITQQGFSLVSDNYQNLDTTLELKCPQGHAVFVSLRQFRVSPTCPLCLDNEKNNFEQTNIVPKKTKKFFRVIALDQSTTVTGYAIFDDNDLIKSGVFKPKSKDIMDRIVEMHQWFLCLIKEIEPDCVVFEDIQKQQNIKTFRHLSYLLGSLIITAKESDIPYETFLSTVWRSLFRITAGTRTDKKQAAKQKVIKMYDFIPEFDEAEAILLGKYYVTKHRRPTVMVDWT